MRRKIETTLLHSYKHWWRFSLTVHSEVLPRAGSHGVKEAESPRSPAGSSGTKALRVIFDPPLSRWLLIIAAVKRAGCPAFVTASWWAESVPPPSWSVSDDTSQLEVGWRLLWHLKEFLFFLKYFLNLEPPYNVLLCDYSIEIFIIFKI